MSFVRKRLLETLPDDEDLRYALDEQFLNTYISTQIRVLRESQDPKMTQAELAKAAKTGQSQISEMEGDYSSWSLRTLRKLARAFGLRLFVTFESWGELIPRMEGFQRENLVRPRIEDDPAFTDKEPTVRPEFAAEQALSAQKEPIALAPTTVSALASDVIRAPRDLETRLLIGQSQVPGSGARLWS
jgi:transcriptional regulator with XRE-family HTH domain